MIIFKRPADITSYLTEQASRRPAVGFVPTMGALHEGHIALVRRARSENELLVCSVFVNPTQFNNREDFQKYPHTVEKDIYQLEGAGCDIYLSFCGRYLSQGPNIRCTLPAWVPGGSTRR